MNPEIQTLSEKDLAAARSSTAWLGYTEHVAACKASLTGPGLLSFVAVGRTDEEALCLVYRRFTEFAFEL